MTRLFRSKSYPLAGFNGSHSVCAGDDDDDDEQDNNNVKRRYSGFFFNGTARTTTTPFRRKNRGGHTHATQSPILAVLMAALRKSLVTCSVERDDVAANMDIGWPIDVRHVSHVTFDRFNGFLGLPDELQPDVPRKVPSASMSVFGVSPQSMQCSYDHRGNSVPTILLKMQSRLYSEGGLRAEGIFRINAENSEEKDVRSMLNRGVVPHGIDVHCLAGLIKAWFRELPTGVLDSLTPEQVMHCNTEEECTHIVKLLPPTDAALFDWAVNLMADVVEHECYNKMNARNIAMIFAPNMTKMADPLTALIHAVQVMNFLKTLITKTLVERERENLAEMDQTLPISSADDFPCHSPEVLATNNLKLSRSVTLDRWESECYHSREVLPANKLSRSVTLDRWESERYHSREGLATNKHKLSRSFTLDRWESEKNEVNGL
ncbi:PREDICTED: rho GTPase-activating protein 5-like [Ipomoea nil]|uniref:rho GTPase-activating protein 5-like n=1 Tax=Ipomoea nil TaxID=35883 RepID=UPI000901B44F|nr:PREDICTED: rho GTPase-activating protein 5-like [Ipomoea nil]